MVFKFTFSYFKIAERLHIVIFSTFLRHLIQMINFILSPDDVYFQLITFKVDTSVFLVGNCLLKKIEININALFKNAVFMDRTSNIQN